MATIVAAQTGVWSAGATWTGGVKPGSDDTAQTGAYTVTIDENVTCTRIEATSSGHFEVTAGGITINAAVLQASTYVSGGVRCLHTSGTVTINGTVTGGSQSNSAAVDNIDAGALTIVGNCTGANGLAVRNTSTGALTITGDVTGGGGTTDYAIYLVSTGAVQITGTVSGGAGNTATGLYNASTATVTITGSVTGGGGENSVGVYNNAGGTINISGDAIGGSNQWAQGARNNGSGTVTVDRAIGGSNPYAAGLYGHSSSGTTTYKRVGVQTNGNSALSGFCKLVVDADYNVIVVKDSAGNDVSMSNDYPAVTDVKSGVVYNRTTLTGTLSELGLPDDQFILEAGGGNYHAPSVGEVIDTAVFGSNSGTAGTFAVPTEAQVEDGVGYGAGGTEFEGELVAGGGMGVSIEAGSAELGV